MSVLVLVESNTTGTGRLFCLAARKQGLRPVVLTRDPSRYPYLSTDGVDHLVVDTTDLAALLGACAGIDDVIAGVTSSSELAIERAAEAARALGLPHPLPEAVALARDKAGMRAALRAAGLPSPGFAVSGSVDDVATAADRIGYPVVVKPVRGTGSAGVRLCADEVRAKIAAARLAPTEADPVLIESYVDGPEFSVETFDDRVVVVVGKHLGPLPHFVEIGHDLPARAPAETREVLATAAIAALRALGLGWGAAHVELRHTPDGPQVIEVNPRLAGGMIPAAVADAMGVDLIGAVVAKATGQAVDLRPRRASVAAIRFAVATRPGVVTAVHGVAAAEAEAGVTQVAVTAPPGAEVRLRHSFQDRLGCVVALADNAASAEQRAEHAVGTLRWEMRAAHVTIHNGLQVGWGEWE